MPVAEKPQEEAPQQTAPRSEKVRLGIKAQAMAVQRLKEQFPEEFQQLHGNAREELGLPRETGRTNLDRAEKIRRRIARLQSELDDLAGS